jgi:hypothetical protein
MRFTKTSTVRMWVIDSNPNPDETNAKLSEFSAKVPARTHTCVAKLMISARRDLHDIITETQMRSRSLNQYTL